MTGAIKKIWMSEKAAAIKAKNQYVFLVASSANKNEIKKEVSRRYGVKVESVNIVRLPGKSKRFREKRGRRPGVKKAVVTLKAGEKIEFT